MREEERLTATADAQCVVSGGEESAANPATGVGGMNEEKEHLTVSWMNGRVTDAAVGFVDRDQEHIRRRMVGNELIPVLRREHRLGDELAKVGPARAYSRVEYSSDGIARRLLASRIPARFAYIGRSVSGDGGSKRDSHGLQSDLVHEMPPRARGVPSLAITSHLLQFH